MLNCSTVVELQTLYAVEMGYLVPLHYHGAPQQFSLPRGRAAQYRAKYRI